MDVLSYEYGGRKVAGDDFARLLRLVREGLPVADLDMGVLEESLRHLAGTTLDRDSIVAACHLVAGNLNRIRAGRPTPPWRSQRYYEWVPVQAMRARPEKRGKDRGALLSFKILAGTPAGLVSLQWWSLRRCRFHSRDFGFDVSRRDDVTKYPYSSPSQLVTLRLLAMVDPDQSDDGPGLSDFDVPKSGAIRDWNRAIIRLRARVDPGVDCPHGLPQSLACHYCRHGRESCPAGTHLRDYEERPCRACGREDALWDPEVPGGVCVDCLADGAAGAGKGH